MITTVWRLQLFVTGCSTHNVVNSAWLYLTVCSCLRYSIISVSRAATNAKLLKSTWFIHFLKKTQSHESLRFLYHLVSLVVFLQVLGLLYFFLGTLYLAILVRLYVTLGAVRLPDWSREVSFTFWWFLAVGNPWWIFFKQNTKSVRLGCRYPSSTSH